MGRGEGNSEMNKRRKILMIAGALIGAFLGSSIGIAGYGSAIAGTIPLAAIGGYIGYRLGSRNSAQE